MIPDLASLELELRRQRGVVYVGFKPREDALVVQVMAGVNADMDALRIRVETICASHVEGPVVVEMAGGSRPSRIRLLDVYECEDENEIEVHLAYENLRTIGRARAGDPTEAAAATFEALERLGARVPFKVEAAALFEHEVGDGVMLVLGSPSVGNRYGVASAPTVEQAAVRATLHALNRYLATQALPATVG